MRNSGDVVCQCHHALSDTHQSTTDESSVVYLKIIRMRGKLRSVSASALTLSRALLARSYHVVRPGTFFFGNDGGLEPKQQDAVH